MKRFLNFKNDLAKHLAECRNLSIKIFFLEVQFLEMIYFYTTGQIKFHLCGMILPNVFLAPH